MGAGPSHTPRVGSQHWPWLGQLQGDTILLFHILRVFSQTVSSWETSWVYTPFISPCGQQRAGLRAGAPEGQGLCLSIMQRPRCPGRVSNGHRYGPPWPTLSLLPLRPSLASARTSTRTWEDLRGSAQPVQTTWLCPGGPRPSFPNCGGPPEATPSLSFSFSLRKDRLGVGLFLFFLSFSFLTHSSVRLPGWAPMQQGLEEASVPWRSQLALTTVSNSTCFVEEADSNPAGGNKGKGKSWRGRENG